MMKATSLNERSFAYFPAFYQKNGKKVYNSRNFAPPSPEIVPGSFPAPVFSDKSPLLPIDRARRTVL